MTKKKLRPQQVAPVQRETTGTSSQQGQVTPHIFDVEFMGIPFAGADAE